MRLASRRVRGHSTHQKGIHPEVQEMGEDRPQLAADRSGRQGAIARLILALVAVAFGGGIFYLTSALWIGWRIGLAVLVAAPILLLVDLLRDSAKLPPG